MIHFEEHIHSLGVQYTSTCKRTEQKIPLNFNVSGSNPRGRVKVQTVGALSDRSSLKSIRLR